MVDGVGVGVGVYGLRLRRRFLVEYLYSFEQTGVEASCFDFEYVVSEFVAWLQLASVV